MIFPEDIDAGAVNIRCLCKPGVVNKSRSRGIDIAYQLTTNANLEEQNNVLLPPLSRLRTLQLFILKLKAPIINKEGFKLLLGYNYMPERYSFERIGEDFGSAFRSLDEKRLKSNALSLLATYSINDRYYASVRGRVAANGDYESWIDFDNRYAVYNLISIFGIKKREDTEWGFGLSFSHSFRRTIALPFLFYNRSFNEKWGIESVLPVMIMGRYNIKPGSILLFGFTYNSRSYSVDLDNPETFNPSIYHLNHSELLIQTSLEQQIIPWLWFNVRGGFQFNFSTDFELEGEGPGSFQVDPQDAFFFRVGIFLSPPDKFF